MIYVLCLETFAEPDIHEQLWLCAEWICAIPGGGCRFYIREDRASLAYIIDPSLRHLSLFDHIL